MAIFEHWRDGDGGGDVFFSATATDDMRSRMLEPGAVKCCDIEAETWEAAMMLYHRHQGWEDYKPMEPGRS